MYPVKDRPQRGLGRTWVACATLKIVWSHSDIFEAYRAKAYIQDCSTVDVYIQYDRIKGLKPRCIFLNGQYNRVNAVVTDPGADTSHVSRRT